MTETMDRFYRFMGQYADFMEEMAASEDRKYQALISADVPRVDKAIAEMQANMMRLEKLEAQRELLQAQAGLGDLPFREILARLPEAERPGFTALFERFNRSVSLIQQQNVKSMSYAEMSLQIHDMAVRENGDATYTADGAKAQGEGGQPGSVFETKI